MRYSNWCKIVDNNSKYYGQVFKVFLTHNEQEFVNICHESNEQFKFSQIQFCVTKDNEPVKIGEEYVCWDNIENEEDLFESYHGKLWSKAIQKAVTAPFPEVALQYVVQKAYEKGKKEAEDLHPTNKIKITAEKIEELKGFENDSEVFKKINELIRAFNRLSK